MQEFIKEYISKNTHLSKYSGQIIEFFENNVLETDDLKVICDHHDLFNFIIGATKRRRAIELLQEYAIVKYSFHFYFYFFYIYN